MTKTYALPKDKWLELEHHLMTAYDIASEAIEYDTTQLGVGTSIGAIQFRGDAFIIKPTTYKGMDSFSTQDD